MTSLRFVALIAFASLTVACKAGTGSAVQGIDSAPAGQMASEYGGTFSVTVGTEGSVTYAYALSQVTATSALLSTRVQRVDPALAARVSNDNDMPLTSSDGRTFVAAAYKVSMSVDMSAKTASMQTYYGYAAVAASVGVAPGVASGVAPAAVLPSSQPTTIAGAQGAGTWVDANGHTVTNDGSSRPITAQDLEDEKKFIAEHPECADYDCQVDLGSTGVVFSKSNHTHAK
jgi:hypothetical protein